MQEDTKGQGDFEQFQIELLFDFPLDTALVQNRVVTSNLGAWTNSTASHPLSPEAPPLPLECEKQKKEQLI